MGIKFVKIKEIMESQRRAFWKRRPPKTNAIKEDVLPVRTSSFNSSQVVQLFEEMAQRNLDIYNEVM